MPTTSTGLNILVVDDSRTDLAVISAMLSDMGHTVTQSDRGEAALELFRRNMPDMVLMDVVMPGMDGYEAVREMRRIAQDDWIPIIFITALGLEENIVRGVEAGGDDYLLKPVHYKLLHAKVEALHRHLRLFRRMEDQSRLLLDYQKRSKAEQQSAQEFMGRLLALDQINDPLVQFHLKPAETFSGDLIAAARTPAGHLYAMLADSTGHGLTAALAVMPVLQAFYAMVAKGFSIGALAAEINRKIREYMPTNRFVAAVLVSLDTENGRVSVWNGGCPPATVLNPDNTIACQFKSVHLPLGILLPEDFDDAVEYYSYGSRHCQILLCSDGAVESMDTTCSGTGISQLLQAACSGSMTERLTGMIRQLEQQLAGKQAHDDIALILVDCRTEDAETAIDLPVAVPGRIEIRPQNDSPPSFPDRHDDPVEWQFDLVLSAQQLRHTDIVPMLLHVVGQVENESMQGISGKLFLILSELFNNALDHGLLGLDSAMKNDPQGLDRYFEERASRMNRLENGEIRIRLAKISSRTGPCLKISITDSGEGFDFLALQAAAADSGASRYGRGLMLVESLSGKLHYTDNGRRSHVCIPLRTQEQCTTPVSAGGCNVVRASPDRQDTDH